MTTHKSNTLPTAYTAALPPKDTLIRVWYKGRKEAEIPIENFFQKFANIFLVDRVIFSMIDMP